MRIPCEPYCCVPAHEKGPGDLVKFLRSSRPEARGPSAIVPLLASDTIRRLRHLQMRSGLACFLILLASPAAWAINPNLHISQYGHTAWRVRDALLPSEVMAIAQTVDGYLWVGTKNGLLRFDGVRFVPLTSQSDEHLPSSAVSALLAARDGSLWIGTSAGLSHWISGHLANIVPSGRTTDIIQDRNGTIWFNNGAGSGTGRVCQIVGYGFRCYRETDGIPAQPMSLAEDPQGTLWIGGRSEVVRWTPDSQAVYTTEGLKSNENQPGVSHIALDASGSAWVGMSFSGTGARLQQLMQGTWKPFNSPAIDTALQVSALLLDRQGTLWIGAYSHGIYRIRDGKVEHFGGSDGLSADFVEGLYEDREGNLWVATTAGLDLFRDVRIATLAPNQGLQVGEVDGVLVARDGTIWIGSDSALEALHGDDHTVIRTGKIHPGAQVTTVFEDHLQRLWVGVDQTLSIYENGIFKEIKKGRDAQIGWVVGITEDIDNDIWAEVILKQDIRELLRIRDSQVVEQFSTSQIPAARRVAPDPGGGLWLGLINGDIARMKQGRAKTFHFEHSPNSILYQLAVNADGTVLGATTYGLVGIKNEKQQVLTTRNGLPCQALNAFLTDASGNLWLDSPCGVIEIADAEMQKWWQRPDTAITVRTFDTLDGVKPGPAGPFPAAGKSPDGRLWFGHGDVLQVIDPAHLATNAVPPPVHIEEVIADRKTYAPLEGLSIPPLTRDLQIDYTALSLAVPQKVLFRYQLEGRDSSWQEPGTRRQAFYTDLRPGKYRFHVTACNNDGVWNSEGASLDFVITPAWYQTAWFRVLCVAIALLAVWVIFRLRVRQIASAMNARFDERLAERTRIARDLHDTFLQTIQGSKLVADDALDPSTDPDRMRRAVEQLSAWLGRATQEGRAALNSLRMSTLERNDLAAAFRRAIDECRLQNSMEASFSVAGESQEMHPIVRDEVYRIGYEAIRNACVHSHASHLWVELTYSTDLTVRIRDDGVGMNAELAARGKEGHFGLRGMRERAARIAGDLQIESSAAGTRVELTVPGGIIFSNATSARKGLWAKVQALLRKRGLSNDSNQS
jgi:signal transduction histidine kinase/ligand-binding sensor domain-containing protein